MERFVKGDVVVLPFPYTDLSDTKKRPSLVVANVKEALEDFLSNSQIKKRGLLSYLTNKSSIV